MNRKTNATVETSEPETLSDDATLEELKKKIAELENAVAQKSKEVDSLKQDKEGWLVWTSNAAYNGTTMHVLFTDGMAFIQKDKVYPEGHAEKVVKILASDFGYNYQYFTKEQSDELQQMINKRAMERAEAQAKINTQSEMMDKLLKSHRL